uniref:Dual specificity mitogen-activated protein kinase kinase 1 (Trinotate prediction) n=1 Tax=Myxobolus squamalis TaxID=59785 RepID=A0A6B2G608_MYXSQ
MANTFVGTRSYMAPERLKGSEYTVRSDIWSLGLVIVELATGRYPYPPIPLEKLELLYKNDCENPEEELAMASEKDLSLFELLGYIVDSDPPRLLEPFFSHDISDFVCQCLKNYPAERADLETLLKHAFVTKYPEISVTDWIQKEAIDIE